MVKEHDDKVYISVPIFNIVMPRQLFEALNQSNGNIDIGSKLIIGNIPLAEVISIGLTDNGDIELLLVASSIGMHTNIRGTSIAGLRADTKLYCLFGETISRAISLAINDGICSLVAYLNKNNNGFLYVDIEIYIGKDKKYIEEYVLPNLNNARLIATYTKNGIFKELTEKYNNNMDDLVFNECIKLQYEVANIFRSANLNNNYIFNNVDEIYEFEEIDDIDYE